MKFASQQQWLFSQIWRFLPQPQQNRTRRNLCRWQAWVETTLYRLVTHVPMQPKKRGSTRKKKAPTTDVKGITFIDVFARIASFLSKYLLTFGCRILQQPCLDPSGDQKNRLGIPKRDWVATTYFLFALRNQYWLASAGWRSLQFTSYFWSLKEVPSPFSGGITALSSLPPLLSIRMHVCYLP